MRKGLDELLTQVPTTAREPVRTLAEEGLSQLPQDLHAAWIDGASQLAARSLNASVLLAYLRLTPPVIRQGGAALQAHLTATALSIALRADAATAETLFTAVATATRRLITTEALLGFL